MQTKYLRSKKNPNHGRFVIDQGNGMWREMTAEERFTFEMSKTKWTDHQKKYGIDPTKILPLFRLISQPQ